MNLSALSHPESFLFKYEDDKFVYFVKTYNMKLFEQADDFFQRVQTADEVIDLRSNKIIKHRYAALPKK